MRSPSTSAKLRAIFPADRAPDDGSLTFGQSLVDQGMAGSPNKAVPAPPPGSAPAQAAAPPPAQPAPSSDAAPVRGVPLSEVAGAGGAASAAAWENDDEEELWELARELLGNTHTVEGLSKQERDELLQILRENLQLRKRLQDE